MQGTDLALSQGVLKLQSPVFGRLSVPKDKIAHIRTDGPVWVIFTDQRKRRAVIRPAGGRYMTLELGGGTTMTPFTAEDIDTIALGAMDPFEVRRLWNLSGAINLGSTVATGNTEVEQLHVDGNIVARREDTRYTARGEVDYRKERGVETTNSALLQLKHDHFYSDRWFFYTTGGVEHDDGKSLTLRTTVGTGTGYQIYETDRLNLSVEGGLSYVMEDYSVGDDQSFPAARWSTDFRYDPWLKKIRVFHFHEIFGDLTGDSGTVVRSRTGMRYFLIQGLNATAQMNVDWDSDPAPGEVETDITYLVTLGYSW